MAFCGVCNKECCDASVIKCTGKCETVFHLDCVKHDAGGKITRSTKDWKCSSCKKGSSNQGSVKSTSSTSDALTKDFLIKVMEGFKREVFAEISSFKTEVSELATSVQFISDKLDASTSLMEEVKRSFSELKKENESLKSENIVLSREVMDLRDRMRNLEQYSRNKNVEISGLPVTRDENSRDLVADVGAALGVDVKEADIAAAHRVPSYRSDREPALIVQFTTRGMKEEWITKSRKKRNLTARDVNQHFPVKRVYVNEHLCPENKQFLARIKEKGRELGYTYVWCRDGKFFARKAEGQPVIRINTFGDLDKIK